jgi:hypothetical protein
MRPYPPKRNSRLAPGVTLVELVITAFIGVMVVMIVGMLLVAGQRNWISAYNQANRGIQIDALQTMIDFGSTGRKSNKKDYMVYDVQGSQFTQVLPAAAPPFQILDGKAVEFRYWKDELSAAYLDPTQPMYADTYALFYLDGTALKVDTGPYPPGAITSGERNTGGNIVTRIVARNVTSLSFSHTTLNATAKGQGSVRIDAVFTDPCDNATVTVKAATFMRNVWQP